MAKMITRHSPVAIKLAKHAVQNAVGCRHSYRQGHRTGLHLLAFASEDQKEGMRAFLEKRKPNYKGK